MSSELMQSFFIRRLLPIILSILFLYTLVSPIALASEENQVISQEIAPQELIVQYQPGVTPHGPYTHEEVELSIENNASSFGIAQTAPAPYWKVSVDNGATIEQVQAALEQDPTVAIVEPNKIRRMTATPDDPELATQWHLVDEQGINAEGAWDYMTGSADVVVAVIDTGVDVDHPDLAANMWVNTAETAGNGLDDDGNGYVDDVNGYDFVDVDGDPTPAPDGINNDGYADTDTGINHGTHVSGIIAAVGNNTVGVSGVAWTASIMGVRALDDEGSGTDSAIAEAIHYAVDNGADIINMSLGAYGSTTILEESVEYAVANGVLVIAAAGNDAEDIVASPFYPACYASVVGVGATNSLGEAASYSNFGADCVDLSAPGSSIYSTFYTNDPTFGFTDDYGYESGTSMATPVVAGVAALVLASEPELTDVQVSDVLVNTADDVGLGAEYGSGRVNAYSAVTNTDIVNLPTEPSVITGYTSAVGDTTVASSGRSTSLTPYFTWTGSTDNSVVAGYYVYFGTNPDADPVVDGVFQTETSYQGSVTAGNNTTYYLLITATDDEANNSLRTASFTYIIDTKISKVKKVTSTLVLTGVQVEWKKLKNENVSGYLVLRRIKGEKKFTAIATVSSKTVSYIDTSVARNQTAVYRVRAIDDLSNKSDSKTVVTTFVPRERVVIAPGVGGGTVVGIYDVKKRQLTDSWYAFDSSATYGVELAVGNFDKDNNDEIVTAIAGGTGPEVRVYEANGKLKKSFLAYDSSFTGGVRVAAGNFDSDARDEIATVAGPGASATVKIFESDGTLIRSWSGFNGNSTSGAYITAVQWDGRQTDEIALSPDAGSSAPVIVFTASGKQLTSYAPYGTTFTTGMRIASAQLARGKKEALLTIPVDGVTRVEAYKRSGPSSAAKALPGFYGFPQSYTGGGTIGSGTVHQGATDRLIVGSNGNRQTTVHIYSTNGKSLKQTIFPFVSSYTGPVNTAAGWLE